MLSILISKPNASISAEWTTRHTAYWIYEHKSQPANDDFITMLYCSLSEQLNSMTAFQHTIDSDSFMAN
jgi:hypothetical protein